MDVGIGLPQASATGAIPPARLDEVLAQAEASGFTSVWTAEGQLGPADAYDPLALIAYAAKATQTLRLGVSVLILPLYQPVRLARVATTLDHLSEGRLELGLGVGARDLPWGAFGTDGATRGRRFEASVNLLRALWSGEPVTTSGDVELDGAQMRPVPVQDPLPLWFGAHSEVALRRTVRMADGWFGAGSVTTARFGEELALLRRLLAEHGRDPASLRIAKRAYVSIDRRPADDDAWFRAVYDGWVPPPDVVVSGGPQGVLDELLEIKALGVDELVIHLIAHEASQFDVVAERLLPRLRG